MFPPALPPDSKSSLLSESSPPLLSGDSGGANGQLSMMEAVPDR